MGSDLSFAHLMEADLEEANLISAILFGTYLDGVNLRYAEILTGQIAATASLLGATLPNGTRIETKEQEAAYKQEHRPSRVN